MATIGQQLTALETGWRRYDDTDSRMIYTGTINFQNHSAHYNNSCHYLRFNSSVSFKFKGSKIRVIGFANPTRTNQTNITIDGVTFNYTEVFGSLSEGKILFFEKVGLSDSVHIITITNGLANGLSSSFDCIDIDSTGYLCHPTLNQVSDINTMEEGDCIPCRYTAITSGQAGYFSELGTCIADEIPVTGTATPDGLFYLIKTNKGTLIADRVVQTGISWDTLNSNMFIEGKLQPVGTIIGCNFDNDVVNASSINLPISINGTAVLDTTQSRFGTKSLKITSGSYVNLGKDNLVKLNGGDFSIETWIYVVSGTIFIYGSMSLSSTYDGVPICYDSRGLLINFPNSSNSGWASPNLVLNSTSIMNQWVHIVVERKHNVLTGYVNGIGGTPYNMPNEIQDNNGAIATIGGYGNNYSHGTGYLNGYRIVKGKVTFGSNFTPKALPLDNFNDVVNHRIRSLSGGVSYVDSNGNQSLTDKSLGAWPPNNEWDTYIVKSDLNGKITPGDDNIWHYSEKVSGDYPYTWCRETPSMGLARSGDSVLAVNSQRVVRKKRSNIISQPYFTESNTIANWVGFRPVLNYVESDIASEVIY